jgi:hypothetical protein
MHGKDSYVSRKAPIAGFFKHGNELLDSIIGGSLS